MKLLSVFCYFSTILTSKEKSLKRINLIFDRVVNKMLYIDGSIPIGLSLKYDEIKNEKLDLFIWDKYFPRPIHYFFECDMSWKFNDKTRLQLKFISSKGDKICRFDVLECYGEFERPIFNDINDKKLNIEARLENIISSHEEDIESVKNSIRYINMLDFASSYFFILMERFDVFIKEIRVFYAKYRKALAYNDKELISKVKELEFLFVKITNTFIKSTASLRIPTVNKLEFVKSHDEIIKKIDEVNNLIRTILNVLNRQLENYSVNEGNFFHILNNFKYKLTNFSEELKKDEPYSINDRLQVFLKSLNNVNDFVIEIKSKNKPNTQISLDCNIKNIDSFVYKYTAILIEYCDILENCDEVVISRYISDKYVKQGNLYYKPLEDFFADTIISKVMKEYLLKYHGDKTDFLIFSQTDYFKEQLLARIIDNLQDLAFSYNLKNKFENLNDKSKVSDEEHKYIKRIEDFNNKLKTVFKTDDYSGILSFEKLLNAESDRLLDNTRNRIARKLTDNEGSYFFSAAVVFIGCFLGLMIYFIIRKRRINN